MYTIKIAHKFPCNAYAKQGNEKLFYCGDVIKRERETHTHTWLDNVVIFPARDKNGKMFFALPLSHLRQFYGRNNTSCVFRSQKNGIECFTPI